MDNTKTGTSQTTPTDLSTKVASLNGTEVAILCTVVHLIPKGSDRVLVCNKQLAATVEKSLRTIQSAFKRMEALELLRREPVDPNDTFSKVATTFSTPDLVAQLQHELPATRMAAPKRASTPKGKRAPQPRKRVDLTVNTATFPFRSIGRPERLAAVPNELDAALSSGRAYWSWLAASFGSLGRPLSIKLESQNRSVKSGERGGPITPMRWVLPGGPTDMHAIEKYAKLRAQDKLEVTFRLCGDNHPLLLVDDVPAEALHRLPQACALLETSPGSFQATLIAPRSLSKQERLFGQRALIDEVGGDFGANNSSQLRRFPGSLNNKPALAMAFVTRIHRVPTIALTLEAREMEALIARGAAAYKAAEQSSQNEAKGAPGPSGQAPRAPGERDQSGSGQDFAFAIEQIEAGVTDNEILAALAHRAGMRRKGGAAPGAPAHQAYARRTLKKAHIAALGNRSRPARAARSAWAMSMRAKAGSSAQPAAAPFPRGAELGVTQKSQTKPDQNR